ncbi:MAG: rhodanese-like domain-containing protein [Gemmataceae bacterium]
MLEPLVGLRTWLMLPVVLGATLLTSPSTPAAEKHTTDPLPTVLKAINDRKAVLVDVREKTEWDDGRLAQAKHLPLSQLQKGIPTDELSRTLPKGTPIYLHCASGRRCLKAASLLRKAGYDVRPLQPGFDDLVTAGFTPAK